MFFLLSYAKIIQFAQPLAMQCAPEYIMCGNLPLNKSTYTTRARLCVCFFQLFVLSIFVHKWNAYTHCMCFCKRTGALANSVNLADFKWLFIHSISFLIVPRTHLAIGRTSVFSLLLLFLFQRSWFVSKDSKYPVTQKAMKTINLILKV